MMAAFFRTSFRLAIGTALLVPALTLGYGLGQETLEKVRSQLRKYQDQQHIPGMTAAIILDGKIIFSEGFGYANLEKKAASTKDTLYRTASVGKMLTAAAAMQAADQGKLDLDADIRKYCDFPAKPWPITERQLLSHLSGIRHYGGPNDHAESFSTFHYDTISDSTKPFRDDPLTFQPGTNYLYSTYGYVVAGLVLEGAVKQPYLEYMHDHFFQPIGMIHTRDDDPRVSLANRAAGYVMDSDKLTIAPLVDMSNRMPAGGFLTTAEDLATFAGALMDGRIVKPSTFRTMMTPARLKNGDTVNYGTGLSLWPDVSNVDQIIVVSHGGSSPGASGILTLVPSKHLAIALLTNLEVLKDREILTRSIAETVLGEKLGPN